MNSVDDIDREYDALLQTDSVVALLAKLSRNGDLSELASLKACVVCLAKSREELLERLTRVHWITPRRMQRPDGVVMRWDAPDAIIPIEVIR